MALLDGVSRFIYELGSANPTPGGGAASAAVGALGAAAALKVANLTVGKPGYESAWEQAKMIAGELESSERALIELADADAQAYASLAKAYKMPKSTKAEMQERLSAIQTALPKAIDVPLKIMQECANVIECSVYLAIAGNANALSDAKAGALFAHSALLASKMNALGNAEALSDDAESSRFKHKVRELESQAKASMEKVLSAQLPC